MMKMIQKEVMIRVSHGAQMTKIEILMKIPKKKLMMMTSRRDLVRMMKTKKVV